MTGTPNLAHVADMARRRAFSRSLARSLGLAVAVGAGVSMVAVAIWRWGAVVDGRQGQGAFWLIVLTPIIAAIALATAWAWWKRPSVTEVLSEVDLHLKLHDQLASGTMLSAKGATSDFEREAVEEAEVRARQIDHAAIARAMPIPRARSWVAAAVLLLTAGGAAVWLPAGWGERLRGSVVGAKRQDPAITLAQREERAAQVVAAQKIIEAVQTQPAPAKPDGPAAEPMVAEANKALSELARQLEKGEVSPTEAQRKTAEAMNTAADTLESRARRAEAATQALRDQLAATQRSSSPSSELGRALSQGDIDRASRAAESLSRTLDGLSPQERERLAKELRSLSDAMERPKTSKPSDSADEQAAKPSEEGKPRNDPGASPDENTAQAGKGDPSETQGERDAAKQAEELRDKLRDAADELERQPPAPPESSSSPSGEKSDADKQEKNRKDDPKKQPSGESAGQDGSRGKGDGEKPESGQENPGSGSQTKPGEQPAGQSRETPADKPSQDGQTQDGQTSPSNDPSGTPDKPGASKDAKGAEQGEQGKPSSTQPSAEKPAEAPSDMPGGPTSAPNAPRNAPTEDPSKRSPDAANQREGQPQDGKGERRQERSRPSPERQAEGAKPESEGAKPEGKSESGGLKGLHEQIERLRQQRETSKQDRRDAQRLREQAERMWDEATPEQRKELEQLAREMARDRSDPADRGQSGPGQREPDDAGQQARGGRPVERGDPGSDEPGTRPGTRPVGGDERAGPTPTPMPREQVIDARDTTSPLTDPGRTIAQWLSERKDRGGQVSGPSGAAATEAVQRAAKAAEQAIEQRVTPPRLNGIIRKYFDRLPGAIGVPSQPGPAPATPADAPAPSKP